MAPVKHPVFARFYAMMSRSGETKLGIGEHRDELLAGLAGRVIEPGAGNGLNFPHYPSSVSEVVALEPEPYLRAKASEIARQVPIPVTVIDATIDRIPFPDASFDAGVVSLVLCSVANEATALAELQRVIKPGAELRFYEHVLSPDPGRARWQRRIAPIWRVFGGGCHPDRDTAAAIEGAGFTEITLRRLDVGPATVLNAAHPHILGRATRL